jgi:hypothetical protein
VDAAAFEEIWRFRGPVVWVDEEEAVVVVVVVVEEEEALASLGLPTKNPEAVFINIVSNESEYIIGKDYDVKN